MMTALSTLKAEEEFCQVVMKKPETGIINQKQPKRSSLLKGLMAITMKCQFVAFLGPNFTMNTLVLFWVKIILLSSVPNPLGVPH